MSSIRVSDTIWYSPETNLYYHTGAADGRGGRIMFTEQEVEVGEIAQLLTFMKEQEERGHE